MQICMFTYRNVNYSAEIYMVKTLFRFPTCKKGGQVSSVHTNENQADDPPNTDNYTTRPEG